MNCYGHLIRTGFFILISLIQQHLFAQKDKHFRFESYNAVGVTANSQTTHGLLQTVNGMAYGPFYAGLGVGVDYARIRSVPLFLDLRYRYGTGKNRWFAYADGGYNFPWDDMSDVSTGGGVDPAFKGGLYLDGGLGYQRMMGKRSALFVTLGYSEKYLSESYTVIPFCPGPGICDPYTDYAAYRFKRFIFKLGWKF